MPSAKQIKVGMTIMHEGELWRVLSRNMIAPGNWRAFIQTKLRNVLRGSQKEHRFGADENVERAILDKRPMEYLYHDGNLYHFMDPKTYEQIQLSDDILGDVIKYLVPNTTLAVESYEEKPIGVELPATVKLKVTETEPGLKTATVTNTYKAATMETGVVVQVPPFIRFSPDGDHFSWRQVTRPLQQPTRRLKRERASSRLPIWPCSGRGLPHGRLHGSRGGALTSPFHPCLIPLHLRRNPEGHRRFAFCCTFPRSRALGVTQLPALWELGLSSTGLSTRSDHPICSRGLSTTDQAGWSRA
jgi:elongation factor P